MLLLIGTAGIDPERWVLAATGSFSLALLSWLTWRR
jgi:hypothetical protein